MCCLRGVPGQHALGFFGVCPSEEKGDLEEFSHPKTTLGRWKLENGYEASPGSTLDSWLAVLKRLAQAKHHFDRIIEWLSLEGTLVIIQYQSYPGSNTTWPSVPPEMRQPRVLRVTCSSFGVVQWCPVMGLPVCLYCGEWLSLAEAELQGIPSPAGFAAMWRGLVTQWNRREEKQKDKSFSNRSVLWNFDTFQWHFLSD